jgi:3-isopropylmalate/(R)-2-methylmalate dehydratase small subunit
MQKFDVLTGIAAPLPVVNCDTDKIIPARFLKAIKKTGLGKNLFDAMRYKPDGSENPNFVLNNEPYRRASILIAFDNFGCGSSREHAPWALVDFGIRCIIAPSFADIFFTNCFKNGMLPIALPEALVEQLMEDAELGANATFTVDLVKQQIVRPNGEIVSFDLDPFRKHCLLEGRDDIGLTLEEAPRIEKFEGEQAQSQPWLHAG